MKARAEARFMGRVQGVFFRDFTQRAAHPLGITGWVMNMPDGSVEAVFEGEKEKIKKLIDKLETEHPTAKVENTEVKWSEPKNEFRSFEVRYH